MALCCSRHTHTVLVGISPHWRLLLPPECDGPLSFYLPREGSMPCQCRESCSVTGAKRLTSLRKSLPSSWCIVLVLSCWYSSALLCHPHKSPHAWSADFLDQTFCALTLTHSLSSLLGLAMSLAASNRKQVSRSATLSLASPVDCCSCQKPIRERYLLKALDQYWHEDCLKCSCCDCRLGEVGSTLFTKANLILCKRDYLRYGINKL